MFTCTTLADGTEVLDAYPEMVCGTAQHKSYMAMGILGTAVYTVGFPVRPDIPRKNITALNKFQGAPLSYAA